MAASSLWARRACRNGMASKRVDMAESRLGLKPDLHSAKRARPVVKGITVRSVAGDANGESARLRNRSETRACRRKGWCLRMHSARRLGLLRQLYPGSESEPKTKPFPSA